MSLIPQLADDGHKGTDGVQSLPSGEGPVGCPKRWSHDITGSPVNQ